MSISYVQWFVQLELQSSEKLWFPLFSVLEVSKMLIINVTNSLGYHKIGDIMLFKSCGKLWVYILGTLRFLAFVKKFMEYYWVLIINPWNFYCHYYYDLNAISFWWKASTRNTGYNRVIRKVGRTRHRNPPCLPDLRDNTSSQQRVSTG
jgi:hypothetical protein